jgi:uncharacterized membrane protein
MNPHVILALFHILIVVPCLLFVAFRRAANEEWTYWTLFGLGIFILAYHGIKAAYRLMKRSSSAWVNLFHALLIAPLLIYIGYYGKKTERAAYELLAIAAFGALGYHLYNLMLQARVDADDD